MLSIEAKVNYLYSTTSGSSIIYVAKLTLLFLSSMLYLWITLVSVNCPLTHLLPNF